MFLTFNRRMSGSSSTGASLLLPLLTTTRVPVADWLEFASLVRIAFRSAPADVDCRRRFSAARDLLPNLGPFARCFGESVGRRLWLVECSLALSGRNFVTSNRLICVRNIRKIRVWANGHGRRNWTRVVSRWWTFARDRRRYGVSALQLSTFRPLRRRSIACVECMALFWAHF